MKTNFNISQDERQRILEMHENKTKNLYLSEQAPPIDSDLAGTKQYQNTQTASQPKQQPSQTAPVDNQKIQQLNNFYKLTYNNTINLQKKLNSLGYQLKEDGVLGKNTYNALMRILDSQQNKDIKPIEAAKPKELPIQQNQQSMSTVNVPAK